MKILVLCTGNSCRSQMAHGFLDRYLAGKAEIYSAGVETHGVNPRAIESMHRAGIDISDHSSNHVNEYSDIDFDLVLTVCDHARESCPVLPGDHRKIHRNFEDPARFTGSEAAIAREFDRVRDEIGEYCDELARSITIK